jgi:hypothetical protein
LYHYSKKIAFSKKFIFYSPRQNRQKLLFLNLNFFDLNFFCTFTGIKKQIISAYHVFRKYRLKTIHSGTNFPSFLDFRLLLSITAQSIFAVEPTVSARWKGISIDNFTKIKNKKNNNIIFVLLGVTENGITQKNIFLIFFKIMQIICNFGFWKIELFKKYHRTIFLFKLQNG